MKKTMLLVAGLLLSSSLAFAQGEEAHHMNGHMHGDMGHNPCSMQAMEGMQHNPCSMDSMKDMKEGTFLKKEVVDGYEVSFHVMKAPEGMKHGGTHHVMIKVEKNNQIISLQAVNSKVTHPNDNSESKMMMKMGDWYMVGYDLNHAGDHEIMVLFKTDDGKKHFAGVTYFNQ
ncbi:MAG: hypothetical protein COB41_06135 [Proteobacteria bacterium]|nr:MAG: hypothetical protein COB41_06135 [Pseudomonadota bacterium]